jgi:serine/threonine protein kinase/Tol biopolymer transport system component
MSMIGKTIAHYEITSQLGKGGMGEVYQAKDRKLGRDVAIKVLPEEFARDTDRVARFQREAKLLASLNHPNIAAIHGLEESGGTNFLVLELVAGETLADQLKRGPIPVEESLKLALQIADALEAAHEKGVIHRDLKPANIKVTPDGKVKVLDFGLAKAFAGEPVDFNLSNSPTLSNAATQQGVILGTAAYMSPEQARGKSVDKKADIWAFGCVLYEMLTGQAAFQGEDVTEILAAVVKGGANLDLLPANLHPRVREVITRCLQKDLKRRYSSITDARYEIEQALADPSGVLVQPVATVEHRTKLQAMMPWLGAAVILTVVIAAVAVWNLRKSEPHRIMRFSYDLPADQQFDINPMLGHLSAVSPDGSQFAYTTGKGLYLRSVDQLDARLILGADKAPRSPFFSPDGKWLGYWSQADGKLKKISISGAAPVSLCDVSWLFGAIWYPDNTIVYSDVTKGIMRVSADGGTPETLVKGLTAAPQVLPDGKSVLFTDVTTAPSYRIVVQPLGSGKRKELFAGAVARYLPTGHLVYGLEGNLYAVPFNLDKLEVVGGAVPIVESAAHFAISNSGTLVYIPGPADVSTPYQRTLVWVDRKGKEQPVAAAPNDYRSPRISPDGTKLAFAVNAGSKSDIWIWDIVRENMTRLTLNEASSSPLWTLDGRRIAFISSWENKTAIYCKTADGTGEDEKLGSAADRALIPWSWSSDGKTLVLIELATAEGGGGIGVNFDIGALSIEGDHKRSPLLQEKYIELQPKISPDGRWMAYMSNESGKGEVYVRPFPDVNKSKCQVSTSGGNSPLWSKDGRELFYRNDDSVVAVAVQTEPMFKPGKPEVLFRGTYVPLSLQDAHPWDISPDGKRFLMMKPPASPGSAEGGLRKINIVLNWFEELKQRVPVK